MIQFQDISIESQPVPTRTVTRALPLRLGAGRLASGKIQRRMENRRDVIKIQDDP